MYPSLWQVGKAPHLVTGGEFLPPCGRRGSPRPCGKRTLLQLGTVPKLGKRGYPPGRVKGGVPHRMPRRENPLLRARGVGPHHEASVETPLAVKRGGGRGHRVVVGKPTSLWREGKIPLIVVRGRNPSDCGRAGGPLPWAKRGGSVLWA